MSEKWQRHGCSIYRLVETGKFRKGEPEMANEFYLQVQRGQGTTDQKAQEIAAKLVDLMNASDV